MTNELNRKLIYFGLLAILLLGAGLRLYTLSKEDIWYDEVISIQSSKQSLTQIYTLDSKTDIANYPPTYYLIVKFWIHCFGDSPSSVRMPSVIFGALTVLVMFLLAKQLWNETYGLLAALLMAISPMNIYYSQETRVYAVQVFFIVFAAYYFIRYIQSGKNRDGAGYILCMVLAVYFHIFSIFFWMTLWVYHVGFLWTRDQNLINIGKKSWVQYGVGLGISPLVLFRLTHTTPNLITWVSPFKLSEYRQTLKHFLFGVELHQSKWMNQTGIIPFIMCIGIFGFYTIAKKNKWEIKYKFLEIDSIYQGIFSWMIFLIPLLLFTMVSITIHPIYVSWRYVIVALPGFLLISTMVVLLLPGRILKITVLLLMVTLSLLSDIRNSEALYKVGMKTVAEYIGKIDKSGDVLLFVPAYQQDAFYYYYHGKIPKAVPDNRWVENLKYSFQKGHRVWVVLDRNTANPDEISFYNGFFPSTLGTPSDKEIIPPFAIEVSLFENKPIQ